MDNETDPRLRGSCLWQPRETNGTRGVLKKRWPDVIGLGFAKVFRVLYSPKAVINNSNISLSS